MIIFNFVKNPRRIPTATYRIQMRQGFDLQRALELAPYLERLGISHLYSSPILQARAGSTHGYDVTDPTRLDPGVGTDEDFARLTDGLRSRGMGLVIDFVPNHMAADESANLWWRSVLEYGRSSPYSRFFDINWTTPDEELRGKVLLPVLGAPLRAAIMGGQLRVRLEDSGFSLDYFNRNFPLTPASFAIPVEAALEGLRGDPASEPEEIAALEDTIRSFRALGRGQVPVAEAAGAARERLRQAMALSGRIRASVESAAARLGEGADWAKAYRLLRALLDAQPYRMAHWRTGLKRINYRRFFYIDDLVALRMDRPEVFGPTHGLVLQWARQGRLAGLRLDHIDGLRDPEEYLTRLRQETGGLYTVVEKILGDGESLNRDWAVDGTTGYEYLNDLNGLFVDGDNAENVRATYREFTGQTSNYAQVVYQSKARIATNYMAGELAALARELGLALGIDATPALRDAIREIVAHFPVYRTYARGPHLAEKDRKMIETAVNRALAGAGPHRQQALEAIRRTLVEPRRAGETDKAWAHRIRFRTRLQQYTTAVEAKGTEDTAFYRYAPLASLNEVGGNPDRFGIPVDAFHRSNMERRRRWPGGMLATSTHDTKRGEDVRARINVLAELAEEWRTAISRWAHLNLRARLAVRGLPAPDRTTEYLLYQTLVGSWPAGADFPSVEYRGRVKAYMEKAVREEKRRSSWIRPSVTYERALSRFIDRILAGAESRAFLEEFLPFQRKVAWAGVTNSLAQVVLKVASPGIPDIYQGTELWDLSLVDPDNRRPVDYDVRRRTLEDFETFSGEDGKDHRRRRVAAMLGAWTDGRIKFLVLAAALRLRRQHPDVFVEGEYRPLATVGEHASRIVAFARSAGDRTAIAMAPRLTARLVLPDGCPVGPGFWRETRVLLPGFDAGTVWRNVITGDVIASEPGPDPPSLDVARVLDVVPVALLEKEGGSPKSTTIDGR